MRRLLPALTAAAACTVIGLALFATVPAEAEPAGDDPIVTALVTVWVDSDFNRVYGTPADQLVGSALTDGTGRWDIDISEHSQGPLGVVAVIDEDILRHPHECESDPLRPWTPTSPGGDEAKCWAVGGDLFADSTQYLDGVLVQAMKDDSGDSLYGPIPLDSRLAPDMWTHAIAPGHGDYRFYDISHLVLKQQPIGVVLHVGGSASGHAELSGLLWEPSQRQQ